MADLTFNTTSGQTIKRELLIAYLKTGMTSDTTPAPIWSPMGTRVEDSSMEMDWGEETVKDILGNTWTTLQDPTITQSFDPYKMDGGDTALVKIWNMAIKDHDTAGLAACDVLIVHLYAGTADSAMFAERYESCAIRPTSIGGEGGNPIEMPFEITYGGKRTVGTAAINSSGVVTFSAAA